jgi:hypothetical protein
VVRTHTNHYFQQAEYTNQQRAICILNTGAHYIDPRQSSLEFGVRLTSATQTGGCFGSNGSALNLIESITITSRAGDELARIDQADLLHYVTTPFRYSESWIKSVGQSMGYADVVPDSGMDINTPRFSIPLYVLSDLFNYGRLIPPMLASGLRISIAWTPPVRAFVARLRANSITKAATDTISSYTIVNPYISAFSHQLSDGIQRDLNELSAVNGLELVYCDWEPTEVSYAQSNNLTAQLEVRKAASRALQCIALTRNTTRINDKDADSYAPSNLDTSRLQWQLGSLYFPQQPLQAAEDAGTGTAAIDLSQARNYSILAEAYKHTLISFGAYKTGGDSHCAAVPFKNFEAFLKTNSGADGNDTVTNLPAFRGPTDDAVIRGQGGLLGNYGDWGTFVNGMTVFGQTLERTDLFNMSGVPINNARVLSFRTTYTNTNAPQARTLTVFLKYVRLARCFLNNVEVEQ